MSLSDLADEINKISISFDFNSLTLENIQEHILRQESIYLLNNLHECSNKK
tara:strand:- start:910 stop:1062 length:153 start_codon:yes stop_codon:yes gene_type:complete